MSNQEKTTPKADTSRNAVIGLAEMLEDKARRFAPGMPGRDFYMDVADTLRALINERDYPHGT